jgi:hypothetical protein
MSTKRKCYQCGDDERSLDEIRDARNEEIRAWGRKVLADADAALKGETAIVTAESDWEALDVTPETPEQEIVEVEVEAKPVDALTEANKAEDPQPEAEEETEEEEITVEPETEEEGVKETDEAPAPKEEAKPAAKKSPAKAKSAPSKD